MESQLTKLENSIQMSGHSLHVRTVEFLRSNGWEVSISPYYLDDSSLAAREVDIIARRRIDLTEPFTGRPIQHFFVELYVECKYLKNDTWFWFDPISKDEVSQCIQRKTFLPRPEEFKNWNMLDGFFKLKSTRAARLFGDESGNDQKIFEGLMQSIKALHYYEDRGESFVLRYPVVVYNPAKIYEAVVFSPPELLKVEDIFQFFVKFAHADSERSYLVDFVAFDFLTVYQSLILNDIDCAKRFLLAKTYA